MTRVVTSHRAVEALTAAGLDLHTAQRAVGALTAAGVELGDTREDEFVCRWVDTLTVPVPPEADTIIRTITNTINGQSTSYTYWLEGLRAPRIVHQR